MKWSIMLQNIKWQNYFHQLMSTGFNFNYSSWLYLAPRITSCGLLAPPGSTIPPKAVFVRWKWRNSKLQTPDAWDDDIKEVKARSSTTAHKADTLTLNFMANSLPNINYFRMMEARSADSALQTKTILEQMPCGNGPFQCPLPYNFEPPGNLSKEQICNFSPLLFHPPLEMFTITVRIDNDKNMLLPFCSSPFCLFALYAIHQVPFRSSFFSIFQHVFLRKLNSSDLQIL